MRVFLNTLKDGAAIAALILFVLALTAWADGAASILN